MLARHGRAPTASFQTAQSGGERPVSRVRGLSVNLQGAILEIPENWQTVAMPGHDRQDGCDLSPQGPHTESGIAVAGELQSTQPWGYRLQFFWAAASAPPEHELGGHSPSCSLLELLPIGCAARRPTPTAPSRRTAHGACDTSTLPWLFEVPLPLWISPHHRALSSS
jgi:hypothetical protein